MAHFPPLLRIHARSLVSADVCLLGDVQLVGDARHELAIAASEGGLEVVGAAGGGRRDVLSDSELEGACINGALETVHGAHVLGLVDDRDACGVPEVV